MLSSLRLSRCGLRASMLSHQYSQSAPNANRKKEFRKVMVANRGEIATRVFRAINEMGKRSLAIYATADRMSAHILKADESYVVGKGLQPVEAYLNIENIINIAVENQVDAIHPGYGFLSERSDFAEACEKNGIVFIGPSPGVLARMGDKVAARCAAIEAGIPVVPGTDHPITTPQEAVDFFKEHGGPIILKAAYGGGGRGMRRIDRFEEVEEAFKSASREALTAFGDGSMFVEKFVIRPRHIEVQLLGDNHGNVIHLFERDCSVQRRHAKVVAIAPAMELAPEVRDRILHDSLKIARHVGYQGAGTVEFLLDQEQRHYFIEVNPRLQVEHTVTEEITKVDIVQSQIKIAEGHTLNELGLHQDAISVNGSSVQCKITTEDPANNFQPDHGRIGAFRVGKGMGIRIDGNAYGGAVVNPYYDSLLVKMIATARTHPEATDKMRRALDETRIRGVKTNIPFLRNVVKDKEFRERAVDTYFIDEHPDLFIFKRSKNRGQLLMRYLADVNVNGPLTLLPTDLKPASVDPECPYYDSGAPKAGFRDIIRQEGPEAFAKAVRNHRGLLITDTTFRDAHQSLLATRVRTRDLKEVSPFVARAFPNLYSVESWGGATFDVALQFLHECPWDRLRVLRKEIPNIPFQMAIGSTNLVGYRCYPDNVVNKFCDLAVKNGMDIFRVFDCLNYLPNMIFGINAAGNAGAVVEASIAYNGDVSDSSRVHYNLDYYLKLTDELVKAGIHVLCIKDMAGVLKPEAGRILVGAIREKYPDLPIHVHSHDTGMLSVATMLECAKAGADIVDAAVDSMSGLTSQPSMGAIATALAGSKLDTGLDLDALSKYSTYWEETRKLYGPFECTTTMRSGNADVHKHQIPGGQYTNLLFQAHALGIGSKFDEVKQRYAEANELLGDIIKVTPSSKVVGDLAHFMVQNNLNADSLLENAETLSFPKSVVDFLQGKLGQPPYGFPQPLRTLVLRGRQPVEGRPGELLAPVNLEKLRTELAQKHNQKMRDEDAISSALFPREFDSFVRFRQKYGPVDKIPTRPFLVGLKPTEEVEVEIQKGKNLQIKFLSQVNTVNEKGERKLVFDMNGQNRNILVKDNEASKYIVTRQRANPEVKGSVGAPTTGEVLEMKVKPGDKVKANQTLFVLYAMKMETSVGAPCDGVVKAVHAVAKEKLDSGDLVVEIDSV